MPTFEEYTAKSFGYSVNKAARLIAHRLSQNFKETDSDVSIEQWRLLLYLWREDGQTQNSLAQSTNKDEPSVSRIINTMEKHNLVVRTRHPHDRRTNLIYLTETGKGIRNELMAMGEKTNEQVTDGVDPKDLAICIKVLDQVIDNLLRLN